MSYTDILPNATVDYADAIENGAPVDANIAAVNALEAVAQMNRTDIEQVEVETLLTLIGDNSRRPLPETNSPNSPPSRPPMTSRRSKSRSLSPNPISMTRCVR